MSKTVLRDLCDEENWDGMEKLCRKRPKLMHETIDACGDTVLQSLLRRERNNSGCDPNPGIEMIIRTDPSLARKTTSFVAHDEEVFFNDAALPSDVGNRLTPLHLAVMNKRVSLKSFKLIYDAHPEAAIATDSCGNAPLHYTFLSFKDECSDEKRLFLIEKTPKAASMASCNGCLPLHNAAHHGAGNIDAFYQLYKAFPEAVTTTNAAGLTPRYCAVKNKNECYAQWLRKLGPSNPPKPVQKALGWVIMSYSAQFLYTRLGLEPNPDIEPASLVPDGDSIAERAVALSLDWLESGKDLRNVGLVSKYLNHASRQPHLWKSKVQELEQSIPLHPTYIFEDQDKDDDYYIPEEFIDPRHSPDYSKLDSYRQATYLSQYRSMVLNFFRSMNNLGKAGEARMSEILNELCDTVREADDNLFFDPTHWFDDTDASTGSPANVNESLSRCTVNAVKRYCSKLCVDEFTKKGISFWCTGIIKFGWEGMDFGERNEFPWVHFCHEIAGLDIVMNPRRGFSSWC